MQQANIRQLLKNHKKYLDDLPFEIINGRTKEVVARVVEPASQKDESTEVKQLKEELAKKKELLKNALAELTQATAENEESEAKIVRVGECEHPHCSKQTELVHGYYLGAFDTELGEREVLEGDFCKEHTSATTQKEVNQLLKGEHENS